MSDNVKVYILLLAAIVVGVLIGAMVTKGIRKGKGTTATSSAAQPVPVVMESVPSEGGEGAVA